VGGLTIAVLVKPVPDPSCYDRIEVDPARGVLAREGMPAVLDPGSRYALEEALSLRERLGGTVVTVSMAPESAAETLREGLAMGADAAYLLSDRAFAGSDSLATARVLSAAIRRIGAVDLVLAGNESADGGTAHVPSQVGELLDVAHLSSVVRLEVSPEKTVRAEVRVESGRIVYRARLPMVVAVRRGINSPRYISLAGILEAHGKPVTVWGASDLGLDPSSVGMEGSGMKPGRVSKPTYRRRGEILEGSPAEVAARIVSILRAQGVVA